MKKYYIVDRAILPEVLDKVIEARSLVQSGEVKQISDAVKKVGISRGTYYKYKDYVFLPSNDVNARKAVLSLMLHHKSGMLSEVLHAMSKVKANILTINQNIPIHDIASIVISFDMGEMTVDIDELLANLGAIDGVSSLHLVAIE